MPPRSPGGILFHTQGAKTYCAELQSDGGATSSHDCQESLRVAAWAKEPWTPITSRRTMSAKGRLERVRELIDVGSISRRTFLRSAAAMALLTAVPFASPGRAAARMRASLTRSTFSPLLGQSFMVTGGGYLAHVVLAEVNDLYPVVKANDEGRFSLIFTGSPEGPRLDEIADFHHRDIGVLSMFVTPVGGPAKSHRYEAVINRMSH
jgi:hypothetical protein